ncbi:MAG: cell division protein ZapA [Alphaproteobacteria bacterium]
MPNIFVTINQRDYLVGCADGEEERIRILASRLDQRVQEISQSIGQIGDARLLTIVGLMLLDEQETNSNDYFDAEPDDFSEMDYLLDVQGQPNIDPYGEETTESPNLDDLFQLNSELEKKLRRSEAECETLRTWLKAAIKRMDGLANGLEKL